MDLKDDSVTKTKNDGDTMGEKELYLKKYVVLLKEKYDLKVPNHIYIITHIMNLTCTNWYR